MSDPIDNYITDEEREMMVALEDTMGKVHRVSDALRLINSPRQPPDFKAMLRARLPELIRDMRQACRQWSGDA